MAANLSLASKMRTAWCLFGVYSWTAPGRLRRPPKNLWNGSKCLLERCLTRILCALKHLPATVGSNPSLSAIIKSIDVRLDVHVRCAVTMGVSRVEAIPQPSEAALVSPGTPVSFVARFPALAPRVPFNLCTMIGTSGLTAKRLHGWPFTCRPRLCESPSTLHLLLRPDPGWRRVLRGIPLCRGRKPTFRARVPNWICGGHADYLQLCAVNLGQSRRYGKSTQYLHG
jgi:hypothetical protein